MGTARHLPAVSGATPSSTPAPQTALGQARSVPSFMAAFHSGVYIGWLSTRSDFTRSPQNVATFCVAGSSIETFHELPSGVHQFAPACSDNPANQPGSPAENVVRYWFCLLYTSDAADDLTRVD